MSYISAGSPVLWPLAFNGPTKNLSSGDGFPINAVATLDAASEKCALLGYVMWEGAPTSAKTFSSAGGKISFRTGTTTFANAGTTLRVGVQDISNASPPEPDGTFDVYDDLVGATDTLANSGVNTATMSSGSKSIAHGDPIAVVFEVTARGGSDSIVVQSFIAATSWPFPRAMQNLTGTWGADASGCHNLNVLLTADDGTLGIMHLGGYISATYTNGFYSSDTPDERGILFKVPFACKIDAFWLAVSFAADAGAGTLRFYSTPLGTPTALASKDLTGLNDYVNYSERPSLIFINPAIELAANTDYCIALESTNSANRAYVAGVTLANVAHLGVNGLTNMKQVSRSNGTGAFAEQSTTDIPYFGIQISHIYDGASPTYLAGVM